MRRVPSGARFFVRFVEDMCHTADAPALTPTLECPRLGTDRERSLAKALSNPTRVFSLAGSPPAHQAPGQRFPSVLTTSPAVLGRLDQRLCRIM
jgi:hypothetical protein